MRLVLWVGRLTVDRQIVALSKWVQLPPFPLRKEIIMKERIKRATLFSIAMFFCFIYVAIMAYITFFVHYGLLIVIGISTILLFILELLS